MALANVLGLRDRSAKVHLVGDSHMTRLCRQIVEMLGVSLRDVRDLSHGGQTARRFLTCVIPLTNFDRPDIAVIFIGSNDIDPKRPEQYQNATSVTGPITQIMNSYGDKGTVPFVIGLPEHRRRCKNGTSELVYFRRAKKNQQDII